MKARIAEVFDSVQGEGIYLGERQIFVRFFGCNLACRYCDTRLTAFSEYEPEELFKEIGLYSKADFHSISFTGGEPLLQKDFLKEILKITKAAGYCNYLETNGTLYVELKEVVDYLDIVAMDLKLPSSTGMPNLWGMHRNFLNVASGKEIFLKVIICLSTTDEDIEKAVDLIKESRKAVTLVLQPNTYENDAQLKNKTEYFRFLCIKNNIPTCIIPQMHKQVGIR